MNASLQGKVVLVTGAASGIGAATAAAMLREGARLVATDIDPGRGEALAGRLSGDGELAFMAHDVTDEAGWERVFAQAEERFGAVDVLVNNAGVMPRIVPLAETSLEEWRQVMSVNLDGVFLGVKHALRRMKGRGGAIVNVSSVAGLVGMPLTGAYSPSKAGVLSLTRCAALEGARFDPPVRVNAVHPGYIRTDMTGTIADTLGADRFERRLQSTVPLRRLGEPEDIAEAILFLAGERSRYATGSSLVMDGGWIAQ